MHRIDQQIQYWLSTQCQAINASTYAALIQYANDSDNSLSIRALYPSDADTSKALHQTAAAVQKKGRLHLFKVDADVVYLGYPIQLGKQLWGAVVIALTHYDSTAAKTTLASLKQGITWLKFILHERESNNRLDDAKAADLSTESHPVLDNNQAVTALAATLTNTLGDAAESDIGPRSNTSKKQQNIAALRLTLIDKLVAEPSINECAITLVNSLVGMFKLQRVSLALIEKNKPRLVAISNSATFDVRAEPIQLILHSMQEALVRNASTWYPIPEREQLTYSYDLAVSHQRLCLANQSAACVSFLLFYQQQRVAVVTAEKPLESPVSFSLEATFAQTLMSVSAVFSLKVESHRPALQLVKRAGQRRLRQLFGNGNLTAKLVVISCCISILACFIPVQFDIKNKAAVESESKYLVTSPYDGYLGKILLKPGETVDENQVLAYIRDDELILERRRLSSQLKQYRLEYDTALASANRAQSAILNAQVEQAKIELALIENKLQRSALRSPIAGIVVSNDISQSLGAPVKLGETLFEVATIDEYKVSLYIRERDIRFFIPGQAGELSLKSLPEQSIAIRVRHVTPVSEIRDSENVFRVEAEINIDQRKALNKWLRPGMTGAARIHIDRRPLGWIIFRDIWHWLRVQLWF